ncbi:ARM repeat-containing protein [Lactarius sanguifluus]|nr:ARM repeat-containing protein [Lactarius sanguifluus]
MQVPYSSSGALSRAHYALVRKVELAQTTQQADDYLHEELAVVSARLSRPGFSSAQCRECLILLLYCSMNTVAGLPPGALEFALPHAVNLVEAGSSIDERKTGYLFCSEIMPPRHDLKLMLVNTLRKDLEADSIARISLALNYLIQCPSEDVIPAVQARLQNLLSHKSPHIRRRALYAVRALAECDSSMLHWLSPEVSRCLRDRDDTVIGSAITVCGSLYKNGLFGPDALAHVYRALLYYGKSFTGSPAAMLVTRKALRLYTIAQPSAEVLKAVVGLIKRSATKPKTHSEYALLVYLHFHVTRTTPPLALLYDCFSVFRNTPVDALTSFTTSSGSPVTHIRHLLSNNWDEQRLFLSCLACVPPAIWAGTTQDIPPVLEAWEVERVMQLLSSPDPTIRLTTLRLLTNVDSSIVQLYFSQRLQGLDTSAESYENEVLALLEVVKILAGDDAELYARSIKDVLSLAGAGEVNGAQQSSQVLERAVEIVLSSLRDGDTTFGANVATTLLTPLAEVEEDISFSPTLMVVLTALACEYAGRISVSPLHLLRGLSRRMTSYLVSIQEVSILSMIRLAAECHKVPPEVVSEIQHLRSISGRHISRRCSQFEDMINKQDELRAAVTSSRSRSLPDFLLALESKPSPAPRSPRHNPSSPSASRSPLSGSQKLRYAAYEPPPPAQSRRSRAASSTRSTYSLDAREDLSRTVTAGDLAIVAGSPEIRALSLVQQSQTTRSPPMSPLPAPRLESVNLLSPRADLISLDSPFIQEPKPGEKPNAPEDGGEQHHDFADAWDTLSAFSARGWCDGTFDTAVRRLQGLGLQRGLAVLPADQPPFEGELKILILGDTDGGRGRAALRLHDSSDDDEDGYLWRMRSEDEGVLVAVKQILTT